MWRRTARFWSAQPFGGVLLSVKSNGGWLAALPQGKARNSSQPTTHRERRQRSKKPGLQEPAERRPLKFVCGLHARIHPRSALGPDARRGGGALRRQPSSGRRRAYRRAGSDDGILYFDGRKEAIKRPRVRERQPDGSEREVVLETYQAARQQKNIEAQVMAFMEEGLSTRSAERITGEAMSASEISRRFIAHSATRVEELRTLI